MLITSIVWGTTWVISKIGIGDMPALQMASIRQCIAGTIFVSFFIFIKKFPLPTPKQFLWLAAMAVLMFVSANGLSTWSIKFIPAGLSALVGALYPLCVVIIEKIFFKSNRITALTLAGLFLGIAGIAVVFYENAFHNPGSDFLFGIFLSSVAMLSWSTGTILINRNKTAINEYYGLGWQMLIGGILLFFISRISGQAIPLAKISGKAWLCICYLITAGSLIAFVAFIYSMKTLTPAIASLYAYVNPLVAMLAGHFLISEKITWNIIGGSVITLSGVYLVNYSMKRSLPVSENEL